jgi:hypothetical protein
MRLRKYGNQLKGKPCSELGPCAVHARSSSVHAACVFFAKQKGVFVKAFFLSMCSRKHVRKKEN